MNSVCEPNRRPWGGTTLADWRRIGKVSVASTAVAAAVVASGYGIADAAAPTAVPFHFSHPHHPRVLRGTVTSVGTDSFTVVGAKKAAVTILTTSSTKYFESGTTTTPSSVAVGETVVVYLAPPARPATTTTAPTSTTTVAPASTAVATSTTPAPVPLTAAVVDIVLVPVSGRVTSASGTTLTLAGPRGFSRTVDVSDTTEYFERGKSVSAGSVTSGDFVVAWVDPAAPGTPLDALVVDVYLPKPKKHYLQQTTTTTTTAPSTASSSLVAPDKASDKKDPSAAFPKSSVGGTVTSVSADGIAISWGGHNLTVATTATTQYFDGKTLTTATAVAKGDTIRAYGTFSGTWPSVSFTAEDVVVLSTPRSGESLHVKTVARRSTPAAPVTRPSGHPATSSHEVPAPATASGGDRKGSSAARSRPTGPSHGSAGGSAGGLGGRF